MIDQATFLNFTVKPKNIKSFFQTKSKMINLARYLLIIY